MQSPFTLFRKHQRIAMIVLTLMAMFAFVFLDTFQRTFKNRGAAAEQNVVESTVGNLTAAEIQNLMNRRQFANRFVQEAFLETHPEYRRFPPQFMQQQLASITFRFGRETEKADVVFGYMLRQEGKRLGIVVDNAQVEAFIDQITERKLSSDKFRDLLKQLHPRKMFDPKQLYDVLRDELLAQLTVRMIAPASPEPPEMYWNFYQQLHTREKLEVSAVPVKSFVDQVPDPSDDKLLAYFDAHKNVFEEFEEGEMQPGFKQPRKVRLQYMKLKFEPAEQKSFKENPVTDKDVEAYYEEHKEIYKISPIPSLDPKKDPINPEFTPEKDPEATDKKEDKPESDTPDAEKKDTEKKDSDKKEPEKKDDEKKDGDKKDADKPAKEEKPAEKPAEKKEDADKKADTEKKDDAEKKADPEKKSDQDSKDQSRTTLPGSRAPLVARKAGKSVPTLLVAEEKAKDEKPADKKEEKPETAEKKEADKKETGEDKAEKKKSEEPAGKAKEEKPAAEKPKGEKPKDEKPAEGKDGDENQPEPKPESVDKPESTDTPEEASTEPAGPKYRPLDDSLRTSIKEQLEKERARQVMTSQANKLVEGMRTIGYKLYKDFEGVKDLPKEKLDKLREASAAELKKIAKEQEADFGETGLLSGFELSELPDLGKAREAMEPSLDPNRRPTTLIDQTFSTDSLLNPYQAEDPNTGNLYVYWKIEDAPAHVATLDEPGVKEQVLNAWKQKEAQPLAKKRADELAAIVRKAQGSMTEALKGQTVAGDKESSELLVQETPEFTWLRESSAQPGNPFAAKPPPRISELPVVDKAGDDFMRTVFDELKLNEVGVAVNADRTVYYVAKVVYRNQADREAFMKTPLFGADAMMGFSFNTPYDQLAAREQQLVRNRFVKDLDKKFGVKWKTPVDSDTRQDMDDD